MLSIVDDRKGEVTKRTGALSKKPLINQPLFQITSLFLPSLPGSSLFHVERGLKMKLRHGTSESDVIKICALVELLAGG